MTEYGRKHTDGSRSGGQPPRLPSDSVVEALSWLAEQQTTEECLSSKDKPFIGATPEERLNIIAVRKDKRDRAIANARKALAAQPRDDVRELLGYARAIVDSVRIFIGSEYRDERLEPEGEWLAKEAREPHADLCKLTARIDTALQGDEQPDTDFAGLADKMDAKASETGVGYFAEGAKSLRTTQPDTDGLAKDVRRLVIAARRASEYEGYVLSAPDRRAYFRELDQAAEAFASRVPWENEDDA